MEGDRVAVEPRDWAHVQAISWDLPSFCASSSRKFESALPWTCRCIRPTTTMSQARQLNLTQTTESFKYTNDLVSCLMSDNVSSLPRRLRLRACEGSSALSKNGEKWHIMQEKTAMGLSELCKDIPYYLKSARSTPGIRPGSRPNRQWAGTVTLGRLQDIEQPGQSQPAGKPGPTPTRSGYGPLS